MARRLQRRSRILRDVDRHVGFLGHSPRVDHATCRRNRPVPSLEILLRHAERHQDRARLLARSEKPVAASRADHTREAKLRPVVLERARFAVIVRPEHHLRALLRRQRVVHMRHGLCELRPSEHVRIVLRELECDAHVGSRRARHPRFRCECRRRLLREDRQLERRTQRAVCHEHHDRERPHERRRAKRPRSSPSLERNGTRGEERRIDRSDVVGFPVQHEQQHERADAGPAYSPERSASARASTRYSAPANASSTAAPR